MGKKNIDRGKKNKSRNLVYNGNEKRVNDTYAKHNLNNGEDDTKYGEFVSTFHHWLPINEQKEIAKKLDDMTKD